MAIDYDALFGGADHDPCAALSALRPAYMKILTQGTAQRVTFRDRTVELSKVDLGQLKALITQLESECAAVTGRSPRRMAITAGGRYQR